jgi:hypothetical protein
MSSGLPSKADIALGSRHVSKVLGSSAHGAIPSPRVRGRAMKLGEYLQHDAVGLAECVARGEISAGELLDLALRQSAAAPAEDECDLPRKTIRMKRASPSEQVVSRLPDAPCLALPQ